MNNTTTVTSASIGLALAPSGHLHIYPELENVTTLPADVSCKIQDFFILGEGVGLLRLGLTHFDIELPPSLAFWQQFAQIYITDVCKTNGDGESTVSANVPTEEINALLTQAPFMRGVEHLNLEVATTLLQAMSGAFNAELQAFSGNIEAYFSAFHAAWNTVGRVCFHLAESKSNPDYPFAFLATYSTHLSNMGRTQHIPLSRALEEYAGHKTQLLNLLLPVHRCMQDSPFMAKLVDTGAIFKPLAWSPADAHRFLQEIPLYENAGVKVRVPNWWNAKKPPRPKITATIGEAKTSALGLDALLDFQVHFALPNGVDLTSTELQQLLNHSEKLVQIKGQWVEVNREQLQQVLAHWQSLERQVEQEGLSFTQGLRLLAGLPSALSHDTATIETTDWSTVVAGSWLQQALTRLRHPDANNATINSILQKYLQADLRPYQLRGVHWLWNLYTLGLGGCLADDMGLGKTLQMLALLVLIKHRTPGPASVKPHLLILPASLLGNWHQEIKRFAPTIKIYFAHSSANPELLQNAAKMPQMSGVDLVITTYATLYRLPWLGAIAWDLVIADEAQALKNPMTKQTQTIKALNAQIRFVLTGTPIENRLLDLWSLFDFVAPGLLGSSRAFASFSKQESKPGATQTPLQTFYAGIRQLVSPYILRRLKNDKQIITDLPDKTEVNSYCSLSKQQIGLYQQAVNELAIQLQQSVDGIQRRGLVLSYLLRFKQICNHSSQWLGHGDYVPDASGKFMRLQELCEVIKENQEKVLIFTQFREIIPALCNFLTTVFQQRGLFLHGQTPIKERAKLVADFQAEGGAPFFVLSLKAGGTGLNLTAASHVIHFDRWWNPAVENQATDRAYRIGQKKNVLVHKFICRGTIEEKIDALITDKTALVQEVLAPNNEVVLTELSDQELISLVTLDIHRALGENA